MDAIAGRKGGGRRSLLEGTLRLYNFAFWWFDLGLGIAVHLMYLHDPLGPLSPQCAGCLRLRVKNVKYVNYSHLQPIDEVDSI